MRFPLWLFRWLHQRQLSRQRLRGGFLHRWLGERVVAKALWQPNPAGLARAWLVAFPIVVVPFLPLQAPFAAFAAILVRGNILLAIALSFLTTPLTAPVHLPVCYFLGELVRGSNPFEVWRHAWGAPEMLFTGHAAGSLYLGAVILGCAGGALGYAAIHRLWQAPARQRSQPEQKLPGEKR